MRKENPDALHLVCKQRLEHTYALWYCHERALKTDTEEKKLLNKVVIFVS